MVLSLVLARTSVHCSLCTDTSHVPGALALCVLCVRLPAGHGAYLLLYFNNNGKSFVSRDPYWLAAGHEVPGVAGGPPTVLWSQPEVALYDASDHTDRPGYPDFITHTDSATGEWAVYITETQKTVARIHRVDNKLLTGLFGQHNASSLAQGAALELDAQKRVPHVPTPRFPSFDGNGSSSGPVGVGGAGFAFSLWLENHHLSKPGQVLLSSEEKAPKRAAYAQPASAATKAAGVALVVGPAPGGQVTLRFGDGTKTSFNISTDDACSAVLGTRGAHFLGVVADGGPQIATLMVRGRLSVHVAARGSCIRVFVCCMCRVCRVYRGRDGIASVPMSAPTAMATYVFRQQAQVHSTASDDLLPSIRCKQCLLGWGQLALRTTTSLTSGTKHLVYTRTCCGSAPCAESPDRFLPAGGWRAL